MVCKLGSQAGGGGTPYDDLCREAPPKRGGFFFMFQVYERVGISLVEVYKCLSFISNFFANVKFHSAGAPRENIVQNHLN